MPYCGRVAAQDLCLGGAPVAHHIHELADVSKFKTEGQELYPSRGESATANPPGYRINTLTTVIGHGRAAFQRARRAISTGEGLELPWARFWRRGRGHRWMPGDSVIVAARVLPFVWTANVNEVVHVRRRSRAMAVTWGTTARHVLRGEERIEIWQEQSGDVIFRLRSFSRPHAFIAWLTYPLVLFLQHRFAVDVSRRLSKIANDRFDSANTAPPPVERGKPKQENLRGVRRFRNNSTFSSYFNQHL